MQDQILTEFQNQPGVIKEPIGSEGETFWFDADKVRFRFNKPEMMGGWITTGGSAANVWGQPRILETVRALTGERVAIIGTNVGLFASDLSTYRNVTPITTVVPTSTRFSTSIGSTNVLVSLSAHGLTDGTIVGFVSATGTIGGNLVLNVDVSTTALYQIVVVDDNSFEVVTSTTAAATSVAVGVSAQMILHYPAGRASRAALGGWGGGLWNSAAFGWNEPTGDSIILGAALWSMDAWGTELMAVPRGGPLFLYSPQNGIYTNFALVTAAPSVNEIVRVAVEARHVILYGTHDISGNYDPLLIRWCSQEDYTDWTPTLTNTAGDFRINSVGSEIIGVEKMRDQYLIFTDSDLFLQTYIGSNDVFGFTRAAENCGLIARNAVVEYGGAVYWMSNNGQFYKYDGRVQSLPCTVLRYVYDGLDERHVEKIFAGTISQFDEIIWFYTTKDSVDEENDRYVIFNTVENHWTIGTLKRNAWKDRSTFDNILGVGPEGEGLYYHEVGESADTSTLEAFLESQPFDLEDGDRILFCNKIVPKLANPSGDDSTTPIRIYLKSRKYQGDTYITKGPYAATGATRKISTRLRGREIVVRLESTTNTQPAAAGSGKWRLSSLRLGIQPDGKR